MKKIVTMTLAIFALLGAFPVHAETSPPGTAAEMIAADPGLAGRLIEVQVNGMVCDFCAQSLTKVLKKKDEVEAVSISLETKLVIITQKPGMTLSDDEVKKAVSWAGYDTARIERL